MPPPTSNSHMPRTPGLERLARCLERTGAYRVLRRIEPQVVPSLPMAPGLRHALFLDVETTGLDRLVDEIIEVAVVPVSYAPDGEIVAVASPVSRLREPGRPIPPEVAALTGIDQAMVAGHSIAEDEFAPLLATRPLVVAHNAEFDRGFIEALIPAFASLPWACSLREVPWREEGATAMKLPVLLADAGYFHDAHRAADDVLALVELMRRPLPRSGRIAFAELLRSARRDSYRVMALDAPFETRHVLKGRGYRWSDGADGRPRCWSRVVDGDELQAERAWLQGAVYRREVEVPADRLTAWTRYSSRA